MKYFCKHKFLTLLFVLLFIFTNNALASPKVALVLGGGAARGFSHIGLIHALEDNGIPIDILVGTSMGSIISGLYAAGYSVDNMSEIVQQLDTGSLVDIAMPPIGGFVGTNRLEKYFDVLLEGKSFAELSTPFYSVITNLRTGEELALNEGTVSTGILASMSIPALFPPVLINGQYYVDGGMKNAVPANVAKDLGADVIIAVDVKKDLEEIDYDNILNNLQLTLWFMIDGYVETNIKDADVVIVPEVQYDSYMDYYKASYFIDQGYLAGLNYMESIKQAILVLDPDFQFISYTTPGYSPTKIKSLLSQAEKEATGMNRPLAVLPELTFTKEESFPKLGLRLEHGALGWFNLGYRYGFSPSEGGHEAFLGWHKKGSGQIEVFTRKGKQQAAWGVNVKSPTYNNSYLTGTYLSKGKTKWQLSINNSAIYQNANWKLGLSASITEERFPINNIYLKLNPTAKIYTSKEFMSLFELVLVRPYLLIGVESESEVDKWGTKIRYQAGIGSEIQFFGLYPADSYLSVQLEQDQKLTWRFGFQGGAF